MDLRFRGSRQIRGRLFTVSGATVRFRSFQRSPPLPDYEITMPLAGYGGREEQSLHLRRQSSVQLLYVAGSPPCLSESDNA